MVAYARAAAGFLNSLSGLGDWDPDREEGIKSLAITIAVLSFYVLDFSLNGLQASLRALILDRSPSSQQNIVSFLVLASISPTSLMQHHDNTGERLSWKNDSFGQHIRLFSGVYKFGRMVGFKLDRRRSISTISCSIMCRHGHLRHHYVLHARREGNRG
jgi:hypothetical protein